MKNLRDLRTYEIVSEEKVDEINSNAVNLRHKKTGAKVLVFENDDDNKVFAIGFRTPPEDSTGVAHIIEHTVLCGSDKYPSKDPFIELAKGSLNTFLNAMTYPDKTVFPVASCNEKDFRNLIDVYLDAVFHPNIYKEEKIFRQEGWHYELEDADAELRLNGVVYSEMKGVYSSSDGVLERAITKTLFEGHTYGEESGGDPDNIPELTYEGFLDFHRKYYHPSNSYIILYGNGDNADILEKIDEDYLSNYEYKEVDSVIPELKPWNESKDVTFPYSISETESEENASILSLHTVVGGELDPVRYLGFQILEYVLLDVPGAPVREALIEAGIGDDISGGFLSGIRMPYFSFMARNTQPEKKEEFVRIVKATLRELADGKLDKQALKAAINLTEFRTREADFGSYPKGLVYGLQTFDSWLYDADPLMHIRYNEPFEILKKGVDEGFFEDLIKECLLDNSFETVLTLVPKKGLTEEKENELKQNLMCIKSGLSKEEIDTIVRETAELKAYQSEPSSEEDIKKIPLLAREDMEREIQHFNWSIKEKDSYKIVHSDIFTSGISYIKLVFQVNHVEPKLIPYVALLTEVLGYIDTDRHSYSELATLTNLNSGGVGFSTESYPDSKISNRSAFTFSANAKVLYDKTDFAFQMMSEMLFESRLNDRKRLKDIIFEVRSKNKDGILSSGHQTALTHAGAMISVDRWFTDNTKGLGYYRFLEGLCSDFDNKVQEISDNLKLVSKLIFTGDNLTVHIVADSEGYEKTVESLGKNASLMKNLPKGADLTEQDFTKVLTGPRKEAFTTASMVNYVARFGNYKDHGLDYDGALQILRVLLSYDYLWNNIRVLGGAYGCSSIFGSSGNSGFASYRDPKLLETDKVYQGVAEWVRAFDADEREMTKAVIGAMSDIDMPLTPLTKGLRGLSAYYSHVTEEERQHNRDKVLDAQPEDIRRLADIIDAVMADGCVCAIGNKTQIEETSDKWDIVEGLYRD